MLKVLQLSDSHVTSAADIAYRGNDPRASLRMLVDRAREWGPDLVLATGDLSEEASDSSYAFLAAEFDRFNVPVWVTAGNHDDNAQLRRYFAQTSLELPVLVHDGAWRVILLNSARAGEIPGRVDDAQLHELRQLLDFDGPVAVAFHHQPWPVGSPWIDRYPLQSPDTFLELVSRSQQRSQSSRVLLWGHVHQALDFERDGILGHSAPSTVSNSLPGQERFTLDPAGPGCRWLKLMEDGSYDTGLLRPV